MTNNNSDLIHLDVILNILNIQEEETITFLTNRFCFLLLYVDIGILSRMFRMEL